MEDIIKALEALLDKTTEYGKISYELFRLKIVDKTSDVIASGMSYTIAMLLIIIVIIFLNLGLGLWLGDILGKTYYGFFVVAGFYVFLFLIIRIFMYKWIKKLVKNNIIKQMLK